VAVRRLKPDLLFLDVQMPGMDGFDVIEELDPTACPAVIFVTAFDRYAVKAFDVHAVDYLLKPFSRARLRVALDRASGHDGGPGLARKLAALIADLQVSRPLTRFVVKDGERVYFVRAHDVDWLEAAGHYVCLHADGATHVIRETLSRLESRLDPHRFVRVHRSAIVNLDRVKELRAAFHGEYEILMHNGERVTSSRGAGPRLHELLRHR
jgi:two-component system LytT family response regulator